MADNFDEAYREYLKGIKNFWKKIDIESLDVRNLPREILPLICTCSCICEPGRTQGTAVGREKKKKK